MLELNEVDLASPTIHFASRFAVKISSRKEWANLSVLSSSNGTLVCYTDGIDGKRENIMCTRNNILLRLGRRIYLKRKHPIEDWENLEITDGNDWISIKNNSDIQYSISNALPYKAILTDYFFVYAYTVADSWGKIPTGVLAGNLYELGNFDQCLSAQYPIINQQDQLIGEYKGQYCLIEFPLPLNILAKNGRDDNSGIGLRTIVKEP